VQANFQQYTERQRAIDTAVANAANQFGQQFLQGEIEVNGVKTPRAHALRHHMEQTGTTDGFGALLQIDGQGVQAAMMEQARQAARQELQQAAAAGQIPAGPAQSEQPAGTRRSEGVDEDLKRIGAHFEPPKLDL
jgi:hypothetical protein